MAVKFAGTRLVDSAVICHPGSISEQEISAILVCAFAPLKDYDVLYFRKGSEFMGLCGRYCLTFGIPVNS